MILPTLTTSVSMSRYTRYKPDNASSGLMHWGIQEHVGRPLVDEVDWTTKGGCANEASGEVSLVLDIFNTKVFLECLVDCYWKSVYFERATARGLHHGRFRLYW